ncbi:hypothetical protein [Brevibacillus sp. NRS-1366]|uniref:hypothetical protein n=1 Tax=Brevibacillus sp. NRS-1366 TaxID=3233899 RepID=UPI003D24EA10
MWGESAGLNIVAAFPGIRFTPDVFVSLEEAGVLLYPVEEHAIIKGRHEEKVIIGYGNVSEEQIVEGVSRMKVILVSLYPSLLK